MKKNLLLLFAFCFASLCVAYAQEVEQWSGSGIAIGPDLIATNDHVANGADELSVYIQEEDKYYSARLIITDPENDLAIVRIIDPSFSRFSNLPYGFKCDLEDVGNNVYVLGYPLVQTMGREVKLTTGVISATSGFQGDSNQYQVTAAIQPGNSGGPLFNEDGCLIGIVCSKHLGAENVNYAVKLGYLYMLAQRKEISIPWDKKSSIEDLKLSAQVKRITPYTIMIVASKKGNDIASSFSSNPTGSNQNTPDIEYNGPDPSLEALIESYSDRAYDVYSKEDKYNARKLFSDAADLALTNTYVAIKKAEVIYNAGFMNWELKTYSAAKMYFSACVLLEYYADGEVFAKLADCEDKVGNKEESIEYLERGIAIFPSSQSLVVGLINYYVTSGKYTDRFFELLNVAKRNEPGNASLCYVEGNAYAKLGKIDEAIKSYRKCAKIDPNYEYGYIAEGILHYNQALEIQDKAQNEFDDAKYDVLVKQFNESLMSCIEPFERGFELCNDDSVKISIAEYLANACSRFKEERTYNTKYQKYKKIVDYQRVR